jgi:hypothetical protein
VKTLRETIDWYSEVETRQWKRVLHCVEMILISTIALVISATMYFYGDGTRFQPILMFFTLMLAALSLFLSIPFYQSVIFKRWHVQVVIMTFLCGLGVSSLAGFMILEIQLSST